MCIFQRKIWVYENVTTFNNHTLRLLSVELMLKIDGIRAFIRLMNLN